MARGPEQPLKSLNKGAGSRRFVFKSTADQIDELDIDVFRSLAPVKFEPSQGSSFFHESLIAWKELNSAADFCEVYQELFPLVQTLPQLVHHKDKIVQVLLSHVTIGARLSLEPILSLLSDLARDLGNEFIQYVQPLVLVYVDLLEAGGTREPDVLGQVFESLSFVLKHTSEALRKEIPLVLGVTKPLRLYKEPHVQEFTAEAVAYLLRSSSLKQLKKGVRFLFTEAVADASDVTIAASSMLLCFTLKGSSSSMHSRADRVLSVMVDSSSRFAYAKSGRKILGKVMSGAFLRLLENVDSRNMELLWLSLINYLSRELSAVSDASVEEASCLSQGRVPSHGLNNTEKAENLSAQNGSAEVVIVEDQGDEPTEVSNGVAEKSVASCRNADAENPQLILLMYLLNSILEFRKGQCVTDFRPFFALIPQLLEPKVYLRRSKQAPLVFPGPLAPAKLYKGSSSRLCVEIHRYLLALVRSHAQHGKVKRDPAHVAAAIPLWAAAFEGHDLTLLVPFIRGIINEGSTHVATFSPYLLSTLDRFVDLHFTTVLPVVLELCRKLGQQRPSTLLRYPLDTIRLVSFIVTTIEAECSHLRSLASKGDGTFGTDPALLWVALECFPFAVVYGEAHWRLAWEYALSLDKLLTCVGEKPSFLRLQQSLLGAALSAHVKVLQGATQEDLVSVRSIYIEIAHRHSDSPHILAAVVELVESLQWQGGRSPSLTILNPIELGADATLTALKTFHVNLSSEEKALRLVTLRFLSHFQPLDQAKNGTDDNLLQDIQKDECSREQQKVPCQIIGRLLSIESAPSCLENSRQGVMLLSHILVDVRNGKIPAPYLVPLVHAMVGIMHNRFSPLWDAAVQILAGLVEVNQSIVWDVFMQQLKGRHDLFLRNWEHAGPAEPKQSCIEDMWSLFDQYVSVQLGYTSGECLLILLIKTLQQIPAVAERHSRELVPLFLEFVGHEYKDDGESLPPMAGGKDWKSALREWLVILKEMKNARSLYRGPWLKTVIVKRFLADRDPAIQQLALECLLNWKDNYLTAYRDHLVNLISYRTLREELTTWNVGRDGQHVLQEHRPGLIPVLLQVLFPKIMKRSAKIPGKAVAGVQRSAVLGFLSHLDPQELAPFFCQILRPLREAFSANSAGAGHRFDWEAAVGQCSAADFIVEVEENQVVKLPQKRKLGFLYMFQDLLGAFNRGQLSPYLPQLLALVFKFMASTLQDSEAAVDRTNALRNGESAMQISGSPVSDRIELEIGRSSGESCESGQHGKEVDPERCANGPEHVLQGNDNLSSLACVEDNDSCATTNVMHVTVTSGKEIRHACYTILATVLTKFETVGLPESFWDIFLSAVNVSIGRSAHGHGTLTISTALSDCLLALSNRLDLVSLLVRDIALVPNLLAMLSSTAASSTSIIFVLSFVQNVVDLENEVHGEDVTPPLSLILLPHLNQLVAGLGDVLLHHAEHARGLKAGSVLERVLQILIHCSKFVKDRAVAARVVDVLLSLLKRKRRIPHEERLELFRVIDGFSSKLDIKTANRCLLALAPLLVFEVGQEVQAALCHIFQGLAAVIPKLSSTVKIMEDLMAMSARGIQEIDYERRLNAYGKLDDAVFSCMSWSEALLILSIAVRDIGSEDISLRHSSSTCLKSFIHFAASLPDHVESMELDEEALLLHADADGDGSSLACEDGALMETDSMNATAARSVKSLVMSFLFPHARTAMSGDRVAARREWVSLLREMVLGFPSISSLGECQHLTSTDVEVDFFYNIVHLQVHRRIRAMARFRAALAMHNFSQGVLVRLFVPLFRSSLFEARTDKEGNLVGAALETVAHIAAQLPWDPYFGLLMQCFRLVSSKPEHRKILARLISSILDEFHFFTISTDDTASEFKSGTGAAKDKVEGRVLSPEISRVLQRKVLPESQKLMTSERDNVNASLAVTVAKILKFLPDDIMEIELPPLVQTIVNLLKNRRQGIRDEARAALVLVSNALGANFLHFVINILQSSLTKGFELHVLGYTINSILLKVLPELQVGEIDHCLDQLLGSLLSAFLGEVAEEKDVEGIARKMKETRRVQSLESIQLLAKSVTFRSHAMSLLKPVIHSLENLPTPKDKVKLQLILKALGTGIQGNPSVNQEEFLVFVHELLEQGLKAVQDGSGVSRTDFRQNYYLIMEFALNVLHGSLKSLKVSSEQQHVLAMLGRVFDILQRCLASKYDGVLCGALKCLSHFLRFPLPNLRSSGVQLTADVISIIQRFGTSESEVMKASFTLLIVLIRHQDISEISEGQLHTLLEFPIFVDMEGHACATALNLLKAIIGRQLLVPELYDLIEKVEQLMIRSQVEPERKLACQVLLQFLLDYPIGRRRLQQHLDFFITNIGYDETSGREAALEMVHTVITKFPEDVIEKQAESMFLALVTRIANDEANHVRAMAATVLKALVWRISQHSLDRIFEFAISWYQGSNLLLWRPAAQVLGYLIEVMGSNFGRHTGSVTSSLILFLKQAKQVQRPDDTLEGSERDQVPLWQEIYLSLVMVEKLLQKNQDLCLHKSFEGTWELVPSFLLYPHMWVRKVSGRLLGVYFTACGVLTKSQLEEMALQEEGCLIHPRKLIQLASAFTQQLESMALDEDMGRLVVQNLLFVTCLFFALPPAMKSGQQQFWQDELLTRGQQEDGEKSSRSVDLSVKGTGDAVHLIFKQVEKIALRVHPVQTKAALQWFSAMTLQLGESVQAYLPCMLDPLYKITTGYTARPVTDELKLLGEEVMSTLREVIGAHFDSAHSAVRDRVNRRRVARKEADKTYVLRKPEASAKRKLRLTAKHRAQKRRKILEAKVERGM